MAQVAPPPARAVRRSGSTSTRFIADRSATMTPSPVPNPATLCPPPLTARSRPLSRAWSTTARTSRVSAQRTMTAGCLSIMKLWTRLASS